MVAWYENWKDYTAYSMLLTNKNAEEMALHCTKSLFAHTYFSWRVLKEEFGSDKAEDLYWKCWEQLVRLGFENAKKTLNIAEVKDIPTLGRILQQFHLDVLTPSEIIEETDERHVTHITWCPNPALGPADVYTERIAYYKIESGLTSRVARFIAELAGLAHKVDAKRDMAMCLGDPVCRLVYELKKPVKKKE